MAEISAEIVPPVLTDDIDFTFDDDIHHEDAVDGDDFDFSLGGADGKEHEVLAAGNDNIGVETHQDEETSALTEPITEAYGHDEIGYEDEGGENEQHLDSLHPQLETIESGDEIDYEDGDMGTADHGNDHTDTNVHEVADGGHHEVVEPHDDIDFGFETTEASAVHMSEHHHEGEEEDLSFVDHEDHNQEDSLQEDEEIQGINHVDHEDDEDDEIQDINHVSHDEDDEDDEGGEDDEDEEVGDEDEEVDDEDEEVDEEDEEDGSDGSGSPPGSLNAGLDQLHGLHPESTADVTVTWGDEICPLFKAADVADPDSFYLEDLEALDYPLSKFLQTIRSSISSWVDAQDEIFIRIDDLGFEFGETTTEALLNQVTFHNLLALHNTLLKNDDAAAPEGLHITLGTRPNCLLRLRDLVSGAGSGKGLSQYQHTASTSDESSDESDDNGAESEAEASPGNNTEGNVEEDEADMPDVSTMAHVDDVGEIDVHPMAEETDKLSANGVDVGTQAEEHEGAAVDAGHGVDFIEFTHEEAVDGDLLEHATASDLTAVQADHAVEQVGDGIQQENHLGDLDPDVHKKHPDHDEDLDLLEGLDYPGGALGQEQDDHGMAHLDPDNGLDLIDLSHQPSAHPALEGGDEDDFLNLHDDEDATPTTLPEGLEGHKVTTDDVEASLDTSASATLDHDEIDYEEHDNVAAGLEDDREAVQLNAPVLHTQDEEVPLPEVAPDAGLDEIDWDDDGKNGVSGDATSTPATATGKRTRDIEEEEDALIDGLPDTKRHRTGDSPI